MIRDFLKRPDTPVNNAAWARNKLVKAFDFSAAVPCDFTFSRSSTATYWDGSLIQSAVIDEPRFELNGLLLEDSATNLMLNSSALNTGWSMANGSFTADNGVAPDGNTTAEKASTDGTTSTMFASEISGAAIGDAVFYLFAKKIDHDWIRLTGKNQSTARSRTDIVNGTVTYTSGTAYKNSGVKMFGSWARPHLEWTLAAANESVIFGASDETSDYTDTPVKNYHVWGAQVTQDSSVPSSYIPTAGATVTRSADDLSLVVDAPVCLFQEIDLIADNALYADGTPLASWYDGTTYGVDIELGASDAAAYAANTLTVTLDKSRFSEDTKAKIAVQASGTSLKVFVDGYAVLDTTFSGTLPSGTCTLRPGRNVANTVINPAMHLNTLDIYSELANAEMGALTV